MQFFRFYGPWYDVVRMRPELEVSREVSHVTLHMQMSHIAQDFFVAGPPCQPFSVLNEKRRDGGYDPFQHDPLCRPVLECCRHIRKRKPKTFLLEEAHRHANLFTPLERKVLGVGVFSSYFGWFLLSMSGLSGLLWGQQQFQC